MAQSSNNFVLFVGRILFSLIFVIAGLDKIIHFSQTAATMANKGMGYSAIMLIIVIIFELGGGLMVLVGWKARFGAFMLFLFIIPVTYTFHSFWGYGANQVANQMHHFLKNLAILGGSLYIVVTGAGRWSLDRR